MPSRPRRDVIVPDEVGIYHCWSRCVRRAFLCGTDRYTHNDYAYRQQWIQQRLRHLAAGFAVDVLSYAIMENHVHLIPRNRPDIACRWTEDEVARRWWHVCPSRKNEHGEPESPPRAIELRRWLADPQRMAVLRQRLSDVSWFLRLLKQNVARRANHEDRVTGHFWEGRFDCKRLACEMGILAGSVYVDLNQIRAGMASTPEESCYTSIFDRIAGREVRLQSLRQAKTEAMDLGAGPRTSPSTWPTDPDCWLAPIDVAGGCPAECLSMCQANPFPSPRACNKGFLELGADDYLRLVDWTGRQVHSDERGNIPGQLPPILDRLGTSGQTWFDTVTRFPQWLRRATKRPALTL